MMTTCMHTSVSACHRWRPGQQQLMGYLVNRRCELRRRELLLLLLQLLQLLLLLLLQQLLLLLQLLCVLLQLLLWRKHGHWRQQGRRRRLHFNRKQGLPRREARRGLQTLRQVDRRRQREGRTG